MKIAVLGTGGVGGYFGGRLAKAGNQVTFLARGKHLSVLQSEGMHVKSINGDFKLDAVNATDTVESMGKQDLIILGVKAWQVKNIAKQIQPLLHQGSIVLPLQNGVLAADELKEVLPEEMVVGGLCQIISKIEAPGVINHLAVEPTIVFGEQDKSVSERLQKVQSVFKKAAIKAILTADIEAEIWKKFISINISGLLAVTRCSYGELREVKETRQMMIELFDEIYKISQKAGVTIPSDFVAKTVNFIDKIPYDSTSSLTRDVWDGKPSEIEYQNGTAVRLGEKYGVATPINRFVYYSILPSEQKASKSKKLAGEA